ncbi:MAG: hypothetical protein QME75_04205 [Deltaproteobacteria bacterium]|nr:hypothetical protein [Deltaproteobacteria bacterium]
MLKRLFSKFARERVIHKSTMRVDFFAKDLAAPQTLWYQSQDMGSDIVILALHFYARILFELAELNETRVAKELMSFLDKVHDLVLTEDGAVKRPQLPLGAVHLGQAPNQEPPLRTYQADFYQIQDGSFRLDFKASLGKEGFYLPAAFLVFLQSCINDLPEDDLKQLIAALSRLHIYYRYRKDFWDSSALSGGPAFALGDEEIAADAANPGD